MWSKSQAISQLAISDVLQSTGKIPGGTHAYYILAECTEIGLVMHGALHADDQIIARIGPKMREKGLVQALSALRAHDDINIRCNFLN